MKKIKNLVGALLLITAFGFTNILVNTNNPITVQAASNPADAPADWAFKADSVELHDAILLQYPEFDVDGDGFISIDDAQAATGAISLRAKNIAGSMDGIENFVNITSIDLYGNKLTGTIPSDIGNLTKLTKLVLWNNQLSGAIPDGIWELPNIVELDFTNNLFDGSLSNKIGNSSTLKILNLTTNKLTGEIPAEIGNLSSIEKLSFNNNSLSGTIPTEIGNLTTVLDFRLAKNKLTGSIPNSIGNLTNLAVLDLSTNQLSETMPTEIGNLKKLTHLDLSVNKLSGAIPASFGGLSSISSMFLDNNKLTGELPEALRNLTTLFQFTVSWNQLSGPIPDWFSEWTNVVTIFMSGNHFSGEVPASIGNMPKLFQILLDNNELTSVSSGIVQSTTLRHMPLSNNKLTSLPTEVYDYIVANASNPSLIRLSNQTSTLNLTSVGPLEIDYSFAAYPAYSQFVDYGMTFTYKLTQPDGAEINVTPTLQGGQLIIDGADLTQSGTYTLVANGAGGLLDPVLYTTTFEIGVLAGPEENSTENNSNGNQAGNTNLPQTGQSAYEYLLIGSVLVVGALGAAIIASKRKVK